ncbi:hypothetical protein [Rosenbergiella epipactidis]|uniref:hypothetical protein n=1 Tax=Rosenbergiella epipactidis TaxID=1544694 RepID=UPI001F4DBA6D|nr:hypothetical protein [Rosenbergiella epipactidis]
MMKQQLLRHPALKLSTLALLLLTAGASQAATTPDVTQVNITLTGDNGGQCQLDTNKVKAGPVTFNIVNKTATAITEIELLSNNRILGEKKTSRPAYRR